MPRMLDIPNPDSAGESPAQIVLAPSSSSWPTLFAARPEARHRLRDFFSSHIRNRNTRRADYQKQIKVVDRQMALAGLRLAKLLNETIGRMTPGDFR